MLTPKRPLLEAVLITALVLFMPEPAISHVGHGDEFQSKGGVERVKVNTQSDQALGIVVKSIAPAPNGSVAVMIPVTSVVDADGKQLVFVQYGNFYEPVEIVTGGTSGEMIEVTQNLSVGEKLVTEGSLSLYAESRKTKTADAAPSPTTRATLNTDAAHAQADAKGLPHSHDTAGNLVSQAGETTQPSGGLPMGILAVVGGGAVLLVGSIAVMASSRGNKKRY